MESKRDCWALEVGDLERSVLGGGRGSKKEKKKKIVTKKKNLMKQELYVCPTS